MRPTPLGFLSVALALVVGTGPALHAQDVSPRASAITLGGRLQTQYSTSSVDGAASDFFFRRARLTVDVSLTDRVDGRVQPEFAGGSASLKDAYLRLTVSPAFRISVGQFKRAFDLFELSSSTDLSIIERDGRIEDLGGCTGVGGVCSYSRLTERLEFADRDQGVRVDGSGGRLSWQATLTNGAGADTPDANDAKSFSGRLGVALSPSVTVSGQLGVHDYLTPSDEDATAVAWSADVEYGSWRDGPHLQVAVVGGENWKALGLRAGEADFLAAQGVASVYLPIGSGSGLFNAVEPLARLSVADPDRGVDDDGGVILTPGLMLYLDGKNKIGANLDVYSRRADDTEYSFKVQTFLYF